MPNYRTQPTSTLSRELYGSHKKEKVRRTRSKPAAPRKPSGKMRKLDRRGAFTPEFEEGLTTIGPQADRFFKTAQAWDDDREPSEEEHQDIQAAIAHNTAIYRARHLSAMRGEGASHAEPEQDDD